MVSNDDFDGKATHLNYFYLHINFEQIYPKTAIVHQSFSKLDNTEQMKCFCLFLHTHHLRNWFLFPQLQCIYNDIHLL